MSKLHEIVCLWHQVDQDGQKGLTDVVRQGDVTYYCPLCWDPDDLPEADEPAPETQLSAPAQPTTVVPTGQTSLAC